MCDMMYNIFFSYSKLSSEDLFRCSFLTMLQLRRHPRNVEEETKYIELMIVNDHLMVGFAEFVV